MDEIVKEAFRAWDRSDAAAEAMGGSDSRWSDMEIAFAGGWAASRERIKELERVKEAADDLLRRAVIQRDQAEEIASNAMTRNAALVGALHRYGRHKSWCAGCDPAKQDDFCTCGLNDALNPPSLEGASETTPTPGPTPMTPAPHPRPVQWGSQGDSAHTPKGGNDA